MNRSAIVLMVAALSLGGERAVAQTMQPDPAAPLTSPDSEQRLENATSGMGSGDRAGRAPESRAPEGRVPGDSVSPPANDETVGVGGSVDRAPRDIREPFDE